MWRAAYLAKWLNRYTRSEPATASVFFALALGLLSLLLCWGDRSMLLTILCLTGITTSMFAVNVMMITFIPLHFSRYGRTSSMSGFLNSVAYIGCGISNFGTWIPAQPLFLGCDDFYVDRAGGRCDCAVPCNHQRLAKFPTERNQFD